MALEVESHFFSAGLEINQMNTLLVPTRAFEHADCMGMSRTE